MGGPCRRHYRASGGKRLGPHQNRGMRCAGAVLGLLGILAINPALSAQSHTIDEITGIESWEIAVAGVSVALTQILPDQLRAFYINRGFSAEAIEPYATSCVFMTVLRNDAAHGVAHFRLEDWRIVAGSEMRPPLSTESWIKQLQPAAQGNAAMIAFRWAQFPPEHAYQTGGDWNQGMVSMGLRAQTGFNLVARWTVNGQQVEGELENVRCAGESE
jgi:hypothetical protein